ncbi:hypothetical protein HELRODRAFT_85412, partial [Helobdella robusta]|uniref:G-protein coupled receptors family 2 profile 2 domain-containing protein n=1 Tax=Helobdella robusta TaxID=6412 RepID=T1G5W7_HELRO
RYYFVLVSLMWNGVEAHNMYRMLVVVYNSHVSHFILTSNCIAWGCFPALLALFILLVDRTAFDGDYINCSFRCQEIISNDGLVLCLLLTF